jgi:hypothetical protein
LLAQPNWRLPRRLLPGSQGSRCGVVIKFGRVLLVVRRVTNDSDRILLECELAAEKDGPFRLGCECAIWKKSDFAISQPAQTLEFLLGVAGHFQIFLAESLLIGLEIWGLYHGKRADVAGRPTTAGGGENQESECKVEGFHAALLAGGYHGSRGAARTILHGGALTELGLGLTLRCP